MTRRNSNGRWRLRRNAQVRDSSHSHSCLINHCVSDLVDLEKVAKELHEIFQVKEDKKNIGADDGDREGTLRYALPIFIHAPSITESRERCI